MGQAAGGVADPSGGLNLRRLELKPGTALAELEGYAAAQQAMEADLPKTADNAWSLLWDLRTAATVQRVEAEQ